MSEHQPESGDSTTSDYVVLWFAPDGDKTKKFGDNEAKARKFAAREGIAEWNPLLLHRVTIVVEELLPLTGEEIWVRSSPGAPDGGA